MISIPCQICLQIDFAYIQRESKNKTLIVLIISQMMTDFKIISLAVSAIKYNEKRSEETQILCAGCSNAELKNFAPPQTPFSEARDGQDLISWRWSLYLQPQTQFGEDGCTQFRVIMVTVPQTNKQTNKQD